MIIVLEGPDGAGKTSLAQAIEDLVVHDNGVVVRHKEGPPPAHLSDVGGHYLGAVKALAMRHRANPTHVIIVDRLHVGELVYGPLLRGGSRLKDVDAWRCDMLLQQAGAILIHVDAPLVDLEARLWGRDNGLPDGKSGARLDQQAMIQEAYHKLLGWYARSYVDMPGYWRYINTATKTPEELAWTALSWAKWFGLPGVGLDWVGKPFSDPIFLVGDEVNPHARNACTFDSVSGDWLLEQLKTMGILHRVVLLNSRKPGGASLNQTEVDLLTTAHSLRRVVALGQRAKARLQETGLQVPSVPHPLSWMRFNHHDPQQWHEKLWTALGWRHQEHV